MRLHDDFEWDPAKDRVNRRKHKVAFEDAAAVLRDEEGDRFHVEQYDHEHSADEDRYITLGSDPADRRAVLRVSWTDRSTDEAQITHIISARLATTHERKHYAQEISGR